MTKPTALIINGLAGTGSTTVARILEQRLGLEHVYAGEMFRTMAKAEGKSIEQFMADLAGQPERERTVDDQLIARAKEGNVIIESRVLGWLLTTDVPAYKVWLTCEHAERIRRIDQREGTANAHQRVAARERVDQQRYQDLYHVNLADHSVFDQVIDTTKLSPEAVADTIIKAFS